MGRDDYLRKVRALLARANHPTTPEAEAETALRMAKEMMDRHAIEQWEAAMGAEGKSNLKPIRTDIDMDWWWYERYAMRSPLFRIFSQCAKFTRVIFAESKVQVIRKPDERAQHYEIPVYGLQSDVDYFQMLFTDLYIQMSSKIKPKYDPNKSLGENVYNAKEAGMKYKDIAIWAGHPEWITQRWDDRNGRYVPQYNGIMIREMKKFAKAAGLTVHKEISLDAYVEDFCAAYGSEIVDKLLKLMGEEPSDNRMALALRDITELSKEEMYEDFPDLRPHPEDCECDTCHARKCRDPKCKREVCVERRKPLKRSSAGASRLRYRDINHTALLRGRQAGRDAKIVGRGGGGLKRQKEVGN